MSTVSMTPTVTASQFTGTKDSATELIGILKNKVGVDATYTDINGNGSVGMFCWTETHVGTFEVQPKWLQIPKGMYLAVFLGRAYVVASLNF